ncbi:MAG: ribonuclease HII [Candidatus Binatia bacterium]
MRKRQRWLFEGLAVPLVAAGKFEEEAYRRGARWVAGIDEVGVGPLAGPVVAAAAIMPRGLENPRIKDSKLLSAKQRETLAVWIKAHAVSWAVGKVDAEEIDRTDILKAAHAAMAAAFKALHPRPDHILIDGSYEIPVSLLVESLTRYSGENDANEECMRREYTSNEYTNSDYTNSDLPVQQAITKGDRLCFSVAAASILAKVARDNLMLEYERLYPQYLFAQHKGYASALHLAALRQHGPSPIHRRSFRGVKELMPRRTDSAALPLFREG